MNPKRFLPNRTEQNRTVAILNFCAHRMIQDRSVVRQGGNVALQCEMPQITCLTPPQVTDSLKVTTKSLQNHYKITPN